MRRPESVNVTKEPEACRLVAQDPVALVIAFILDQQIRVQQAFAGPLRLRERLGHLDPQRIADMPLDELVEAFVQSPPLHRYPGSMAKRVQQCMQFLLERYDGDPERVWTEATDTADVRRRIAEMPGFGEMKALAVTGLLCEQFDMPFHEWADEAPPYGALAYVRSLDDLKAYQQRKGEYKKQRRAEKQAAAAPD